MEKYQTPAQRGVARRSTRSGTVVEKNARVAGLEAQYAAIKQSRTLHVGENGPAQQPAALQEPVENTLPVGLTSRPVPSAPKVNRLALVTPPGGFKKTDGKKKPAKKSQRRPSELPHMTYKPFEGLSQLLGA